MGKFTGKAALVTGAASGIGRSVAQQYAKHGAQVVVSDVDDPGGQETVRLIKEAGGEAQYVRADVSQAAECEALVQKTLQAFGRLDLACNNAGIGGEANLTGDYSIAGWDQVLGVNLSGVFYCMKFEIQAMRQNDGGAIINMASILGQVGFAMSPAYVAAKHGVVGLTKNAAIEYAQSGIRVNSVGPAFIHTPMLSALEADPDTLAMLESLHPIGRLGQPEEVAGLVMFLSSDEASFITGSYYPVDGGYLAR